MTAGYRPPTCRCGHPAGDHIIARSFGLRPPVVGRCLIAGCGCERFVDDEQEQESDRAAA